MHNKFRKNIFLVGLASFFGGVSQDMFVPLLPIFLSSVLQFSKSAIGISEGLVTASSSIFKLLSGVLADKWHTQKPLILFGYSLSMIARPLLAVFSATPLVFFLRFLDGAGKGAKDSPKSALLANSTDAATRGKSFGVTRALDTLGSVAGPLVLYGLLTLLANSPRKYELIFLLCALPLIATLFIFGVFVKEPPIKPEPKINFDDKKLPQQFYLFLGVMALFTLGNSSDIFLLLRAQSLGVSIFAIPLVYALFNFVYAATSVPLGSLSDRLGRERVIILGLLAYALAYIGFARASLAWHAWVLFAFYGLYYATTQGVGNALIADIVAPAHRGTAYGIYNTVVGLLSLPASFIAGIAWDRIGAAAPFYIGAVCAALAGALLFFIRPSRVAKF